MLDSIYSVSLEKCQLLNLYWWTKLSTHEQKRMLLVDLKIFEDVLKETFFNCGLLMNFQDDALLNSTDYIKEGGAMLIIF